MCASMSRRSSRLRILVSLFFNLRPLHPRIVAALKYLSSLAPHEDINCFDYCSAGLGAYCHPYRALSTRDLVFICFEIPHMRSK